MRLYYIKLHGAHLHLSFICDTLLFGQSVKSSSLSKRVALPAAYEKENRNALLVSSVSSVPHFVPG